ncbi:uncharacterized protein C5orf47 homolog [Neophocaena asiaeorientalis asiaeorientalis]|uniref:Uncharacterized protein C5orf47 homolog n=1 Tax=Neophocaena asiaeorientalis asiaeorientalis TaxID=1706337 RepID=A0A341C2R1_NEOAA|nr:uncharacterized protein C5orf47 homolog [Neophocaena asiaeorientalis asiaeorientalis]
MTAAGREQERDQTRFVYVTRFGSHQCGAVLQLGGRRAQGLCRHGLGAGRRRDEPPAAVPGAAGGGLTQKNLAKKFDFPIPLNEPSKIMKKKKKVSVWNGVYKVISKMLEENEKYRLRLKLCSENSNYTK